MYVDGSKSYRADVLRSMSLGMWAKTGRLKLAGQGERTDVEKSDREEGEERKAQRLSAREDRQQDGAHKEIDAEDYLDRPLDDRRAALLGGGSLLGTRRRHRFLAEFRRPDELRLMTEQAFQCGPCVIEGNAHADAHQEREILDALAPGAEDLALAGDVKTAGRACCNQEKREIE